MNNTILINIFDWSGVVALLAAYILVSTRKLEGDSVPYQALNLGGSALLIYSSARAVTAPGIRRWSTAVPDRIAWP
jgi:hypothetical protein